MSLASIVEKLQKTPLSPSSVLSLNAFQKEFNVEDDDPLIVVLALMARSQIIIESAPDLLQQKVVETIELHRNVLRDQATLIAKDLITVVAGEVEKVAYKKYKTRALVYAGIFVAGMVFSVIITVLLKNLH